MEATRRAVDASVAPGVLYIAKLPLAPVQKRGHRLTCPEPYATGTRQKRCWKGYDLKVKRFPLRLVDSNYFCRLFHKNTERSPSEYHTPVSQPANGKADYSGIKVGMLRRGRSLRAALITRCGSRKSMIYDWTHSDSGKNRSTPASSISR